jgi:hypothetical protein
MKQDYKYMFNEQEFVAVCRKSDYENDNIGDGIFLVCKNEWEDTDDYSIKTFDLLLTSIEGNTIKLYPAPNNAVIIVQQLPYSRKSEYMEIPKEYTFDTSSGSVLFCVSVAISSKPVNFGCRCKVS